MRHFNPIICSGFFFKRKVGRFWSKAAEHCGKKQEQLGKKPVPELEVQSSLRFSILTGSLIFSRCSLVSANPVTYFAP
jgi:hypothetical protein